MTGVKETQNIYLSSFDLLEKRLAGVEGSWLHQIRRDAIRRFAELGFPTTRMEEWKYTNVAPIARIDFRPAGPEIEQVTIDDPPRSLLAGLDAIRLAFVNGRFSRKLSSVDGLPDGVTVGSLAERLSQDSAALQAHLSRYANYQDHAFVALNTAFIEDGAYVEIARGGVLEKPIHLLFIAAAGEQAAVSHPRTFIITGRETQATLIEEYMELGDGVTFTNGVTEIVAGENSVIEYYNLQQESERSFHVATVQAHQARNSNLTSHCLSLGGALIRNDLNIVLDGEGAECALNGLYLTGGRQHVDNHTRIDHAKPHGTSREVYKGILDGSSTAVFNGAVMVRKDAQKTDAGQTNKNLLLSKDAAINTKPQLEILADDVKCTHGATIGQLDREAVFYLRSRGIAEDTARAMLTTGFATEVLDRMKEEAVRARIEQALSARLRFKEPK